MPSSDYERFRRRLEQQLRADVELLVAAYRAKLNAFETVARTRGELGAGLDDLPDPPALALPANLLPGLPGPPAPVAREALPPGGAAPQPAMPAPAPQAASSQPRRRPAYEVPDAVDEALLRVADEFDHNDLYRAMGFKPKRSTLYRILQELERTGTIEIFKLGAARTPTRYRKVARAVPAEVPGGGRDAGIPS